jgi:serine/threonine protein kinase
MSAATSSSSATKAHEPLSSGSYGTVAPHATQPDRYVTKTCIASATDIATYGCPRHHLREIDALQLLRRCPHVLRVFEFSFAEQQYSFSMLRVSDGALHNWASMTYADEETRVEDATVILHSLTGTLHNALQRVGIVHRDVKPANILATFERDAASGHCRVKQLWISDWGSATFAYRTSGAAAVEGDKENDVEQQQEPAAEAASAPSATPQLVEGSMKVTVGAKTTAPEGNRIMVRDERTWTGADTQTQWFRSPEAFLDRHAPTKVDVWSIGVVGLFLLAPNLYAVLRAPSSDDPRDVTQVLRCIVLFRFLWPDEPVPSLYTDHPSLHGLVSTKQGVLRPDWLRPLQWPAHVPETARAFLCACLHIDPHRRASLTALTQHDFLAKWPRVEWVVTPTTKAQWNQVELIALSAGTKQPVVLARRAIWQLALCTQSRLATIDTALHLLQRWLEHSSASPMSLGLIVPVVWCIAHKLHEHYPTPLAQIVSRFTSTVPFWNELHNASKPPSARQLLQAETEILRTLSPPWSYSALLPWMCHQDRFTSDNRNRAIGRLFAMPPNKQHPFASFVFGYLLATTTPASSSSVAAGECKSPLTSTDALLTALHLQATSASPRATLAENTSLRRHLPVYFPKWIERCMAPTVVEQMRKLWQQQWTVAE